MLTVNRLRPTAYVASAAINLIWFASFPASASPTRSAITPIKVSAASYRLRLRH